MNLDDLAIVFKKLKGTVMYDHWGACTTCGESVPVVVLPLQFETEEEVTVNGGKIGERVKTINGMETKENIDL